ncbi:MAG: GNAT family N-acetyltransferase, partial [Bdellovibrionia bacterium]
AVASAELHPEQRNAELTDCATHPDSRGLGLMSQILSLLEEELIQRNYISSYSMARARSFGMNNVFFRLKYEFTGRMVNNCDIFGCYEDMNVWVKRLIGLVE